MGAAPFARLLSSLTLLGVTAMAYAQPPAHVAPRGALATSAMRPGNAAAKAYPSGKQALVGWHAPSDKPPPRDANGRAMLALTTLNRGESLTIPAFADDGGFAAADPGPAAQLPRPTSGDEDPGDA